LATVESHCSFPWLLALVSLILAQLGASQSHGAARTQTLRIIPQLLALALVAWIPAVVWLLTDAQDGGDQTGETSQQRGLACCGLDQHWLGLGGATTGESMRQFGLSLLGWIPAVLCCCFIAAFLRIGDVSQSQPSSRQASHKPLVALFTQPGRWSETSAQASLGSRWKRDLPFAALICIAGFSYPAASLSCISSLTQAIIGRINQY
jgi:hypothetical protein